MQKSQMIDRLRSLQHLAKDQEVAQTVGKTGMGIHLSTQMEEQCASHL